MPELSVVIVAADSEQRAVLQVLVDSTSVARAGFSATSYPVAVADPVIRLVDDLLLVDRVGDRLPHPHVLQLRVVHVEREDLDRGERLEPVERRGELRIGLETRDR